MAARSTRQKIRDQAGKMIKSCEDIAFHMMKLDDLAEKRSEVVNAAILPLLSLQQEFLNFLEIFRNQL